jgi:hypothetical protein
MSKIREAMELPDPNTTGTIDVRQFEWTKLYGSEDVRAWTKGKEIREFAKVERLYDHWHVAERDPLTNVALEHGDRWVETEEACIFTDGTVMVCATISEWQGTFASHDEIRVRFFAGVKASPKAEARKARKRK